MTLDRRHFRAGSTPAPLDAHRALLLDRIAASVPASRLDRDDPEPVVHGAPTPTKPLPPFGAVEHPDEGHMHVESSFHGAPVLLCAHISDAIPTAVLINGAWVDDPFMWVDNTTQDRWLDDIDAALRDAREVA